MGHLKEFNKGVIGNFFVWGVIYTCCVLFLHVNWGVVGCVGPQISKKYLHVVILNLGDISLCVCVCVCVCVCEYGSYIHSAVCGQRCFLCLSPFQYI